ncbi:hypothetical protein P175DRAFT_0535681 [Aspergillus ochraceoroseus IBT 24754]|uniref:Major facilitator superfamily (MFS) profile domain-containing protein n=1 Tax=Aspergillus ochraceoroseus IBT 24754 TaxID=1392256 RepID=A0A2T5LNS5_9EURO|nr:uncharacterized protein P175DRAFT_0535681 [Aspergillus ochraceoroseus IBT 24754]PTU17938.1 hypothetical protein P175DRAFT_0535681 [Aspergillus ochraceoroseus IBT 24754]
MANDTDKVSVETVDNVEAGTIAKPMVDIDVDEEYTYEEQRKIIHRVDRRLILICRAAYCISLMDRINVSIAAISGMMVDLELGIGFRYSTMVLVFFVTYIVFQPVSTGLIRRIGPRIFISTIVMTWGEGFKLTFVIGILCMIFAVDFPDKGHNTWGFLSEKECAFVLRRLNRDRADANPEPFSLKKFLRPALDLKIWGLGLVFFCLTTVTYSIAYFLPIILRENMGFGVGASQCLIAPPYVLAGILMGSTSWAGDKYRMRAPVLVFNSLVTLIGLPVMGFAQNPGVRFFWSSMAYQANNIRGQWTRAFASAILVGFGGVGGIAGSLIFRSQDAPRYIPGIWGAIA